MPKIKFIFEQTMLRHIEVHLEVIPQVGHIIQFPNGVVGYNYSNLKSENNTFYVKWIYHNIKCVNTNPSNENCDIEIFLTKENPPL